MSLSSLANNYDLRATLVRNDTTLNNYDSALLVKGAGASPVVGASYMLIDGTTEVVVNAANVDVIAKDLATRNLAVFLPQGTINVSKAETENKTNPTTYGANNKPSPSGRTVDVFTVTFGGYYDSIPTMNTIRNNPDGFDVWLFNNEAVEIYTQTEVDVQITNVRNAVAGDNTYGRNGMFDIDIVGEKGQVVPLFGINYAGLKTAPKFVLATGTLNNLTLGTCTGDYKRYTRTTTATIAKLPFTVSPTVSCVLFSVAYFPFASSLKSVSYLEWFLSIKSQTAAFPDASYFFLKSPSSLIRASDSVNKSTSSVSDSSSSDSIILSIFSPGIVSERSFIMSK